MKKYTKGFSLIELSVVIIIIGLIIASIIGGKTLINSSKSKIVIAEITKYREDINLFKEKFNYYPGDFSQAYSFWDNSCASESSLCNGNGDWKISPEATEGLLVWRHLFLAELLNKEYSGTNGSNTDFKIGSNLPDTKFSSNGLYSLRTHSFPIFGVNGIALVLSSKDGQNIREAIISPAEAKSIDKKFDDGLADSGNLVAIPAEKNLSNASLCVNSRADTSNKGDYILKDEKNSCQLIYWINKE